VDAWCHVLLARDTLEPFESSTLATLAYRSRVARKAILEWLQQHPVALSVGSALPAIEAVLDVIVAQKIQVDLPAQIVPILTELAVSPHATNSQKQAQKATLLLCDVSTDSRTTVQQFLVGWTKGVDRDAFLPYALEFLSALAIKHDTFLPVLNNFVNDSFAGLVDRFAGDATDSEVILAFVLVLSASFLPISIAFTDPLADQPELPCDTDLA
jgi:hypothetical protein